MADQPTDPALDRTIDLARIRDAHERRGAEIWREDCLLTQLTRACALEHLALESVDMDIRASFPLESKYGVSI